MFCTRMKLVALFFCSVLLVACSVDVPQPGDGQFRCEEDEDCSGEYHCEQQVCVPNEGQECGSEEDCADDMSCVGGKCVSNNPCGACSPESECVNLNPGGSWECRKAAVYDGTTWQCGSGNEAYIEAPGWENGTEAPQLAVCKPCDPPCMAPSVCDAIGSNSGFFDEVAVGCSAATCDDCTQQGLTCALFDASGVVMCLPDCNAVPGDMCHDNPQTACAEVQKGDGTGSVSVCLPCNPGCSSPDFCLWDGQNAGGPINEITLNCESPATDPCGGCNDQECVQLWGNGPWGCVPKAQLISGLYECPFGSAYIEAKGYFDGGLDQSLAVCRPCDMSCPTDQACTPVDWADYFLEYTVACRPKPLPDTNCNCTGQECVQYTPAEVGNPQNACVAPDCAQCTGGNPQAACTYLRDADGTNVVSACIACPACGEGQQCVSLSNDPEPITSVDVQCRYILTGSCSMCNAYASECASYSDQTPVCQIPATLSSGSWHCPDFAQVHVEAKAAGDGYLDVCLQCANQDYQCSETTPCQVLKHRGSMGYVDDFVIGCAPLP